MIFFAATRRVERLDRVGPRGIISPQEVPYTQTVNSSGGEFAPFEKCYQEEAAPIWGAYCKAEPGSAQCRR
jgi:hypothetical protein